MQQYNTWYIIRLCMLHRMEVGDREGSQWECLCHVTKSNFALVWPRSLTSWPPKLVVPCHCRLRSRGPLVSGPLASTSVHLFSKHRVHKFCNRRTDGRTDEQTSPTGREVGSAWRRKNVLRPTFNLLGLSTALCSTKTAAFSFMNHSVCS